MSAWPLEALRRVRAAAEAEARRALGAARAREGRAAEELERTRATLRELEAERARGQGAPPAGGRACELQVGARFELSRREAERRARARLGEAADALAAAGEEAASARSALLQARRALEPLERRRVAWSEARRGRRERGEEGVQDDRGRPAPSGLGGEEPAERLQQLGDLEGLADEPVRPRGGGLLREVGPGAGGDHQDRLPVAGRAHPPAELEPVEAGHGDVEQDRVGAGEGGDGLLRTWGDGGLEPLELQERGEEGADLGVVVDQQDPRSHGHLAGARGAVTDPSRQSIVSVLGLRSPGAEAPSLRNLETPTISFWPSRTVRVS